ncbi:conserved Plasmodium membrane protein, unknown function [Plasmodium gallinaceum]|uniref:Protein YIPF n=1 Tax=Plasmodium gallinaceum TaxID=5849 RepID=A0A1J1GW78_PLAGA|nr:conserved Plasmodium membrane protein, unknown function [Plasmodium gallinaceum]CRG96518.1 conserved Plasmodium membrane protein, unknown function [Plasmodium gallinaceum]
MDTNAPRLDNYEFTMDEPVKDTLIRDVKSIFKKILYICFHQYDDSNTIKKWDLWGSFIVYITLSIIIFLDEEVIDKKNTFAYFFVFFIIGHILVSLNLSLLHINIQFFQSLCIISYSLFPLVFSSFLNLFISSPALRFLFSFFSIVWSSYNCILILAKFIKKNRLLISLFPICLLHVFIATFLLIK